jgi:hypothetical protein
MSDERPGGEPQLDDEGIAHLADPLPSKIAVRAVPEGEVPGAYDAPQDGYLDEESA